jgi:Skp family chaperone for outer membrane proteins
MKLKLALVLATLALSASLAHAKQPKDIASSGIGYVNVQRIYEESEAGKKSSADLVAALQADQAFLARAKLVDRPGLAEQAQQAAQNRQTAAGRKLLERVKGIAAKLRADRHLAEIRTSADVLSADGDLTDAVIALMDAEDKGALDEVARLREQIKAKDAQLAAAKADNAALTKPVAPAVPPPPPAPARVAKK